MSIAVSNPLLPEAFVESNTSDDDDSCIDLWAAVALANKRKSLRESESKPKYGDAEAMSHERSKCLPEYHYPNTLALSESEMTSQCKPASDDRGCRRINSSESLGSLLSQLSNLNLATAARVVDSTANNERIQSRAEGGSPMMPPHQPCRVGMQHPSEGLGQEEVAVVSRRVTQLRDSMSAVECTEQIDRGSSDLNRLNQLEMLTSPSMSCAPTTTTTSTTMDVGTARQDPSTTSDLNRRDRLRRRKRSSSLCPLKTTHTTMDDGVARKDYHDTIVHHHGSSRRGVHRRFTISTVEFTEQSGQNAASDLNRCDELRRKKGSSSVCPQKTPSIGMDDGTARKDSHDIIVKQNCSSKKGKRRRHSMNSFECTERSGRNATSYLNQSNQMEIRTSFFSWVYPPKATSTTIDNSTEQKDRHDTTIVHQNGSSKGGVNRRHSLSAIEGETQIVCITPSIFDRHAGLQRTQRSRRTRSTTAEVSITR